MAENKKIVGGIGAFPKGINSDISPLLLPLDQLAFATNASMRGAFATQRPSFANIPLSDATGSAFQTGVFQGGCYYRSGKSGYLMLAVNGNLFQVAISGSQGVVTQIQTPSQNSTTAVQNWLWQSEQFLIWNDGVNLPVFYDGSSARRSFGSTLTPLGTTADDFPIPPVGSSTSEINGVSVTAIPISGPIAASYWGLSVLVGTTQFILKNASTAASNASLTILVNVLQMTSGDLLESSISNSTILNSSTKYAGWIITGGVVQNGVVIGDWSGIAAPNPGTGANNYFTVRLNQSPSGVSGLQTFLVTSTSGTQLTFTGTPSGNSLVNCQMISPPTVANSVYTVASISLPVSVNQLVQVTSIVPTQTVIGTVYNVGTSGLTDITVTPVGGGLVIPIIVNGVQQISAGQIIVCNSTNGNNSYLDIFVVTSTAAAGGTSQNYATLINQTGTEGNTITAGSSIILIPELPISTIGVYGMGRNWIALPDGSHFIGGDIVGSSSGTNASPTNYNRTDAVLKVSQNAFLAGGTTFSIPGAGESISAMAFAACLDASLGQGFLQVFTNDTVFSCNAPADTTTWANMTNPILTESLIGSGAIAFNAVAQSNADLMFRLSNGGVQSLLLARLDFNQWGNTPISKEISRVIENDNPALLPFCSMAIFNNRMLMTCQPLQVYRGVVHNAIASLNFDPQSSLAGKAPSIWEGQWAGLNLLQLITGFFDNMQRCFAVCLDASMSTIQINEILPDTAASTDFGGTPIQWSFETPMIFQREKGHLYKRLVDGEFYLDEITSGVSVSAYYAADENSIWTPWFSVPVTYQTNDTGYRARLGLGQPSPAVYNATQNNPTREGYDFRVKFVITGACRFLGARFLSDEIPEPVYAKPVGTVPGSSVAPVTPPTNPPPVVSGFTASVVSFSSISLGWTISPTAVSYQIYRSMDGSNFSLVNTVSVFSFLDVGLNSSTVYYYYIVAVNSAGLSPRSTAISETTSAAPSAPTQPTGLNAVVASYSQINLSWTASVGVTSYLIYRSTDGVTFAQISSTVETSYSDTALTASTSYWYYIFAHNSIGNSLASNTANATTTAVPVLPSPVTGLTAVAASTTSIQLTWAAAANATGYGVYFSTDGVSFSGPSTVGITNYLKTGLSANTTYYFFVIATNANGSSAASATVTGTTNQVSAPGQVVGLTAVVSGFGGIALAWTATDGAASYNIYRSTDNATFTPVSSSATNSYTDTGLSSSTLYYYKIKAVNIGGSGPYSTVASATTSTGQVVGLTATAISSNEIDLAWTALSGATNYNIYRVTSGSNPVTPTYISSVNSLNDTVCSPNTKYYYTVIATNAGGSGLASNQVSATTPQVSPPGQVTGLTIVSSVYNSAQLNWDAVSSATSYLVYRSLLSTSGFSLFGTVASSATSYLDSGLSGSTTYYYYVVATNAGGPGLQSSVGSVTTPVKYVTVQLQLISGAGTDIVNPVTTFSLNAQYLGVITTSSLSSWPAMPSAGVGPNTLSITVPANFPLATQSASGGPCLTGYGGYIIGGTCTVAGQSCNVSNASGTNIRSFNVTPTSTSANGVSIGGATVSVGGGTYYLYANATTPGAIMTICNWDIAYYTTESGGSGSFNNTSSGTFQYVAASPNYITLTLSKSFSGAVGNTITVGTAQLTVTSFSGSSVTCQMANSAAQGLTVPIWTSGTPTQSQLVIDSTIAATLVSVAAYPLSNNAVPPVANGPITVASMSNGVALVPNSGTPTITVGQIVQVTNAAGGVDILYVTSVI